MTLSTHAGERRGSVTLFLCGDVMLGRGVDQVLASPGDPKLHESYITDARRYVELAERVNGPIPRPAEAEWVWGEALKVLDEAAPDVRLVNLETAITQSDDFAPGKAIHYRMSPRNVAALAVARPDVCVLANNHVLDFGQAGLDETLRTLDDAGLRVVGAGRDVAAARRPAVVSVEGGGRVVVVAAGTPSSGVPSTWAATVQRAGVDFLPDLTSEHAEELAARIKQVKRPGDIAVASVHWGSNWGFDVPDEHIRFAHVLVDAGVDVVHGHSSHHPRPIEVYRGRLVLYGCGDFIDDYEGIRGYEQFRDDLRVMYLATLEADTGRLAALRMVPVQAHRFALRRASEADTEWMREVIDRISRDFGQRVERGPGGSLTLGIGSPERG